MEIGETLRVGSRAEWRKWLAMHHKDRSEIWLLYNRKMAAGRGGITYEESVEEALCYGWIDGQVKGFDEALIAGRFTPRRARSNWSPSNIARVKRLLHEGRMTDAGLAVVPAELKASR